VNVARIANAHHPVRAPINDRDQEAVIAGRNQERTGLQDDRTANSLGIIHSSILVEKSLTPGPCALPQKATVFKMEFRPLDNRSLKGPGPSATCGAAPIQDGENSWPWEFSAAGEAPWPLRNARLSMPFPELKQPPAATQPCGALDVGWA
jgi:hypothetical protein